MLKIVWFCVAIWAADATIVRADPASPLIVGNIRDQEGAPFVGVRVSALDASGKDVGDGVTDRQGSFAIHASGVGIQLAVACRHCQAARADVAGRSNIAIVVRRFVALEESVPNATDLAALPYAQIGDVLGLIPYALPSEGTSEISDRGLNGGHGLVVDDGAPIVDLATGTGALVDFPGRYVRSIEVTPPAMAFAYGANAGGGRFMLDELDGSSSAASIDAGRASALSIEPSIGDVHPSYGVSSDDGTLSRRADVDLVSPVEGGFVRAGLANASELSSAAGLDFTRNLDLAHVSYEAASRRYRTFANVSASDVGFAAEDPGPGLEGDQSDYRSSYVSADARLEHPGTVALAYGFSATQRAASYSYGGRQPQDLTGSVAQETVYAQATAGDRSTGIAAGLGIANTFMRVSSPDPGRTQDRVTVLPSISARTALGTDAYVRAAVSGSTSVPSLLDDASVPPDGAAIGVEWGELLESAIGYDAGQRVTGEAIAYRENRQGVESGRLDGLGASIVWQVSPALSVRAWTLRDDPIDTAAVQPDPPDLSRQILWTTYDNASSHLRFDMITHRDVTESGASLGIDGDVFVPIAQNYALDLGTVERTNRTYYVGLRAAR